MKNIYRRKVVGVRSIVTEREIKRKTVVYKNGGSYVVKTISILDRTVVDLECGHHRVQYPGSRLITGAKHLDCHECESIDRRKRIDDERAAAMTKPAPATP